MKTLLIALSFLFALPAFAYCPSSYSSCEYYKCAEQHNPCGPGGYYVKFGSRYCEIFLGKEESFSFEAQEWLRENRRCLQEAVEHAPVRECKSIRKAAMESHVGCYLSTGFCELTMKDQAAILWNLRTALATPEAWVEAYNLRKACARRAAGL